MANAFVNAQKAGAIEESESNRKGLVHTMLPVEFSRTVGCRDTFNALLAGNDTLDPYVVITLLPWAQQRNTEYVVCPTASLRARNRSHMAAGTPIRGSRGSAVRPVAPQGCTVLRGPNAGLLL
mmetsp:Transcript_73599/g.209598  ORF Transcript_73599/g.209598 Transcript_73599/m.209598 type:complete len:123 (-) Transcript_73599:1865-2233(-)